MGQHEIARRLVDGIWTTVDVVEDGGGPGGDWGGAGNAQFSGSGSPVGNVTPSAEGDLYVDNTTPALWQATGLTNADWQQVGQGGSQPENVIGWVASVPCGDGAAGCAVGEKFAVVGNLNTNTVTVIDIRTLQVLGTVTVGNTPGWIGLTPDELTAVVASYGDGNVSIIDLATLTVTYTLTDGGNIYGYYGAISPDGATAYLANDFDTLYFVDIAAGTFTSIPMTNGYQCTVSPDGAILAVAENSGTHLYLVDTATQTITHTVNIATTGPVDFCAFSTDGTQVWAACGADGKVVVVDAATGAVLQTITLAGGYIYQVEPSPDGLYMVAADYGPPLPGNDKAHIIDATTFAVLASLDAINAVFVNFSPEGTCFVVGAASPNSGVYVIDLDTLTVVQTLPYIPQAQTSGYQGFLPTTDGFKGTMTDGVSPVGNMLIAERLIAL